MRNTLTLALATSAIHTGFGMYASAAGQAAGGTVTPAKEPKVLTVRDDMPSRAIRDTTAEAAAYLIEAATKYSDFVSFDLISPIDAGREGGSAPGLTQDAEGNLVFDPVIFPESMRVMVSVLTQRGEGQGNSTVKCIVVAPVPSLTMIQGDPAGVAWLDKIIGTELNRIAVRGLRPDDANINDPTILDAMPKTLADYVTSNRGGSSTLLEAYEEYWKAVKQALSSLSKAFKLANLSKREFRFAMSSADYASRYYPTLEETKKGSLFVFAIQAFTAEGKKAGKDVSIFETWLNTRNEAKIDEKAEDDEGELSLDVLTQAMAKQAETPATPEATPAPAVEAPPATPTT